MSSTLFIKFLSTGLIVPGSYAAYSSGMFGGEFAEDSDLSESLASLAYIHMPEEEEEAGLDSEGLVEDVQEKKKSASKRKLKLETNLTKDSDFDIYKGFIPKEEVKGSKLPSAFIGTHMYQAKDSSALENGTKKFGCTDYFLTDNSRRDLVNGGNKEKRGSLDRTIDKGDSKGRDQSAGCLEVIGGKEGYEDKGRGGGRILMFTQNYNYSTTMMVTLEADDGKFMVEGSLYAMQYTDAGSKRWNILAHEKTQPREIKKEDEDYLGIKPGNAVNMKDASKKGTGNGFDLSGRDSICGPEECTEEQESDDASGSQSIGIFTNDGSGKSLDNGSSNYSQGSDSTRGLFKGFNNQHHDGMKGSLHAGGFYGGGRELKGSVLSVDRGNLTFA